MPAKRTRVVKKVAPPVVVEQPFIIEQPKEQTIPNISELFTMKFKTDRGELVGIRRGMKLGSIEIYEVK